MRCRPVAPLARQRPCSDACRCCHSPQCSRQRAQRTAALLLSAAVRAGPLEGPASLPARGLRHGNPPLFPHPARCLLQVKRRETEQQAEARLRSYAHLAAQEEADPWVPLEYHGEASGGAAARQGRLAGHCEDTEGGGGAGGRAL